MNFRVTLGFVSEDLVASIFRVKCSVAVGYQRFGKSCCLHLQGEVFCSGRIPTIRKTSLPSLSGWNHNTERLDLSLHRNENFKSLIRNKMMSTGIQWNVSTKLCTYKHNLVRRFKPVVDMTGELWQIFIKKSWYFVFSIKLQYCKKYNWNMVSTIPTIHLNSFRLPSLLVYSVSFTPALTQGFLSETPLILCAALSCFISHNLQVNISYTHSTITCFISHMHRRPVHNITYRDAQQQHTLRILI
jgi:hypothetical protein